MNMILNQINYIGASAIFVTGLYMVIIQGNLVRKIIGINLMDTSVFLVFVTIGFVTGGRAPVISVNHETDFGTYYVNPLPSAIILTGIVVAVSITVYALSLIVRIGKAYGTIEVNEIFEIREKETGD